MCVRMVEHRRMRAIHPIAAAFRKYGLDSFDVEILEEIPVEKLDEREQFWLDHYRSYEKRIGYNICREAGTTRGRRHTPESIEKIKSNQPKQEGMDNPFYGKKHSPEIKKMLSEKARNQVLSPEHKAALRRGLQEKTLKKVAQIDPETSEVVKVWPSMKSACEALGIDMPRMSGCCSGRPKHKTAKGFMWKKVGD